MTNTINAEVRMKMIRDALKTPEGRTQLYNGVRRAREERLQWKTYGYLVDKAEILKFNRQWQKDNPLPRHILGSGNPTCEDAANAGLMFKAFEPSEYEMIPEAEMWEMVAKTAEEKGIGQAEALDFLMNIENCVSHVGCHPHPLARKKV